MKRNSFRLSRFALTSVALAVSMAHAPAWSLGLGRLTVQSALGEALRAEIDVTSATPEEVAALTVRVAPPEVYRSTGVDYNSVLPATKVTLQRRGDRQILVLASDRAVQEPFVDVILELDWGSGRLVREYTLLFDPPSIPAAPPPLPLGTPPTISKAPPIAPAPRPRTSAELLGLEPPPAPTKPQAPVIPREAPAPARTADASEYRVKPGDTLSGIANQYRTSGVSLEQMLVALQRANTAAFINDNINLLKSGVVLNVPAQDAVASVSTEEAREALQAQSTNFGDYRSRVAKAPIQVDTEAPSSKASSKLKVDVIEKSTGPAPDSTLKLVNPGVTEANVAKERERKEALERVKELTRSVEQLKSVQANAQGSGTTPPGGPGVNVPVTPPVVVAAAPPVAAPAPAPSLPPVPAPAPAPAPSLAPAPETAVAPPALVDPASAPVVDPLPSAQGASDLATDSPAMPSVEPIQELAQEQPASVPSAAASAQESPTSSGSLLGDNSLALVIGGGLIALLAGFGIFRLSRRARKDSGETSFLESRLQPDSFFGASGGQRIDTRNEPDASSSMSYSLSQLDAIGDVDPVAEADVYLAYGRDLQAEEILKEAIRTNPERIAVRTKLLEVFAKRRDTKGFEQLATLMYSMTLGQGEDWARAQELGVQIDPENPLYRPGGTPNEPSFSSEPMGDNPDIGANSAPVDLDLDLASEALNAVYAKAQNTAPSAPVERPPAASDIDFNLDIDAVSPPEVQPMAPRSSNFDLGDISLDLDSDAQSLSSIPEAKSDAAGLDIDDDGRDPLVRKFELAEEFRQIGDMEGARDLLQEVIADADGPLKTKAQTLLNSLK